MAVAASAAAESAKAGPGVTRTALVVGLLAAVVGGEWLVASVIPASRRGESPGLSRPLAEFPYRIGLWTGEDKPLDPELERVLKSDDRINRTYVHPSGERVVLWMNYSKRSTDQYHYPSVCLTGNGWEEEEGARHRIGVDGCLPPGDSGVEKSMTMLRQHFHRRGDRIVVHYWYFLLGEDPVDTMLRKLTPYSRAFIRGRRNGSVTIEVFSESDKPDLERLDDFAKQVSQRMRDWLPPGTDGDCSLGASY
jgi:EpsI family protein